MTTNEPIRVTVLGLGAMGGALATALIDGGHRTTVWNRSPARAEPFAGRGAAVAATAAEAVRASPVVIACLLDHASVRDVLDPLAADLRGRILVNVTTTSPAQARELAAWGATVGVDCLDGGVLAVPGMIGRPGASVLYSGSAAAFQRCRPLLHRWGTSTYLGADPGLASLYDLALLAGMYTMFAGFLHGAAMVAPAGVTAGEFATRAAPWLAAMTDGLRHFADVVDGGDYAVAGQQSLEFSDLSALVDASAEQGLSTEVVDMVQRLIRRQIDGGHGGEGFARIIESIRTG
ncbi:NAD(P)-dependent oxidoreductase [Actinoplanes teichomyceticus]|uniref:3-hydroxyisobutyrate dehydrogenase-like beta-hydroxyacid dehydrogenase n=1 Tax=Actinoplanes teichomyceticus TaxID=1867 RepID=A0A561VJ04_ACTTI|nr:NAD(P)-binding domain-containing protein [Actinoplanes teichomyceticus]TWG11557.1 3-hydroxyisobutyrate dehydrogenase-like beta-hydroxyacid dehydrogenase [Actinoplanes teichomyceticus]GIF16003.1 oxidoreductase [Actinoplanes teichomyceticus]